MVIYNRYVERLADNLTHQLTLSQRSILQITALTNKREEAIETITNVEPQLNALIKETKQLQKQVSLFTSCDQPLLNDTPTGS